MTQAVFQKEYQKIAVKQRRVAKDMLGAVLRLRADRVQNDLLSLRNLRLKGGDKDISSRLDFYLYG